MINAHHFSLISPKNLRQFTRRLSTSGCECFFTVRWMDAKTLAARPKAVANLGASVPLNVGGSGHWGYFIINDRCLSTCTISIYIYHKKQRHCFDSWFMGLDVAFFSGIVDTKQILGDSECLWQDPLP